MKHSKFIGLFLTTPAILIGCKKEVVKEVPVTKEVIVKEQIEVEVIKEVVKPVEQIIEEIGPAALRAAPGDLEGPLDFQTSMCKPKEQHTCLTQDGSQDRPKDGPKTAPRRSSMASFFVFVFVFDFVAC